MDVKNLVAMMTERASSDQMLRLNSASRLCSAPLDDFAQLELAPCLVAHAGYPFEP